MSEVSAAIDRWADPTIIDRTGRNTLALELVRFDTPQETFYARALEGDVQCGALVTKIIERRCVMLGLHTPQQAVLQIVAEATPKETSTDKIERVLNALIKDQKTRARIDRPQERPAATLARPLVCIRPPAFKIYRCWRRGVHG